VAPYQGRTYGRHKPAEDNRVAESVSALDGREPMKLVIGKPDDSEIVLAEQAGGAWKPNPNLAAELATFLQGADPEQFEMWVEEPE
jgi:hypothetical protein